MPVLVESRLPRSPRPRHAIAITCGAGFIGRHHRRPPHGGIVTQGDREPDPRGYLAGIPLAPWWRRMVASTIDWSILYGYLILCSITWTSWWAFLLGLAFLLFIITEESPGKLTMSLRMARPVVDPRAGFTLGRPGRRVAYYRMLMKPLDVVCFGWLWPLLNSRRQTLADRRAGVVFFVDPFNELSDELDARNPLYD
jgi:uncharacterized RDD family membrane protein YckC